jgi:hypothetical protein
VTTTVGSRSRKSYRSMFDIDRCDDSGVTVDFSFNIDFFGGRFTLSSFNFWLIFDVFLSA